MTTPNESGNKKLPLWRGAGTTHQGNSMTFLSQINNLRQNTNKLCFISLLIYPRFSSQNIYIVHHEPPRQLSHPTTQRATYGRRSYRRVRCLDFPKIKFYNDKLVFLIIDSARKLVVGNEGTHIQLRDLIAEREELMYGAVSLLLVQNKIKPMLSDISLMSPAALEGLNRLCDGDMHAVNRRTQLIQEGVVKPDGNNVAPAAVRNEWLPAPTRRRRSTHRRSTRTRSRRS